MRVRLAITSVVLVSVLSVGAALAVVVVHTARDRSEAALRARLLAIAATGAAQIDGDAHARVQSASDPEFLAIRTQLRRIQTLNGLETPIYTLRPTSPTATEFVVMTNEQPFVGHRYTYRAAMSPTFEEGRAVSTEPYGDEHGAWISAYAPVRDGAGHVVALLEVDETAEALGRLHMEETLTVLGLLVLCLGGASLLAFALGTAVARQLVGARAQLEGKLAELAQANQALDREQVAQLRFARILEAANQATGLVDLCQRTLETIVEASQAQAGSLYVVDAEGVLHARACLGFAATPDPVTRREGLVGRVAAERRALRLPGVEPLDAGLGHVPLEVTARPLTHGREVVGVLVLGVPATAEPATGDPGERADPALAQLGIALVNALANERTAALAQELRRSQASLLAQSQELERTNAALRETDRYKSEFIANMSHEFRTPLNAVLGYTDLIELADDAAQAGEYLGRLRQSARSLVELVESLLSYARLEADQEELRVEPVRLDELLGEVAASLEALVAEGVDVEQRVAPGLEVTSDRGKLKQILVNLAGNAAKFTESGRVCLEAQVEHDALVITVSDTGPGIPPEHRESIFAAFRQVDGSATRRHGGTGLGLAIASRLSRLLGGQLELESELGVGSTFRFLGPRVLKAGAATAPGAPRGASVPEPGEKPTAETSAAEKPAAEASPVDPPGASASPQVLLIAAPGPEREVLRTTLLEGGARVLAHDLDPRALASPSPSLSPAAAVIDLGEDGLRALRCLAALRRVESWAELPVVAVGRNGAELRALQLLGNDYLTKPVNGEELTTALRRALGGFPGEVLVVDDDPACRELTGGLLARQGWLVRSAPDGLTALEMMQASRPDGLVLDLMMPGLSGFDVLATMAHDPELCEVPVVILTAKDLTADERRTLQLGVIAVVEKASTDVPGQLARALRLVCPP